MPDSEQKESLSDVEKRSVKAKNKAKRRRKLNRQDAQKRQQKKEIRGAPNTPTLFVLNSRDYHGYKETRKQERQETLHARRKVRRQLKKIPDE